MNIGLEALIELGRLTPLQRERWVDVRIAGLTCDQVAARDETTRGAVHATVRKVDEILERRLRSRYRLARAA